MMIMDGISVIERRFKQDIVKSIILNRLGLIENSIYARNYSDFRMFDGGLYEKLGFVKKHLSKPDYFWCNDIERNHRFNFNKQKLIKEGYNSNKTEVEIMHERGYFRLYSCGQYRWEYEK